MAIRFNLPILAFDDANGNPLAGGFIQFFESGGSVTPKDTYSDVGLTTPNTNIDLGASDPNVTGYVLDSAGRHGDIWCDISATDYRAVVRNSFGTIIKTMDPVFGHTELAQLEDLDALTSYYVVPVYFNVKPTDGETYPIHLPPFAVKLLAGLAGCKVKIQSTALPTATTVFTLYKNALSIGTITISTLGVVTVSFTNDVTFDPGSGFSDGDQFSMVNQATADATANFIAFSFVFVVI